MTPTFPRFGFSGHTGSVHYVGRTKGDRNRASTPGKARNRHHNPLMGTAFVHTMIDDHSRVAYAEIHDAPPPPP